MVLIACPEMAIMFDIRAQIFLYPFQNLAYLTVRVHEYSLLLKVMFYLMIEASLFSKYLLQREVFKICARTLLRKCR